MPEAVPSVASSEMNEFHESVITGSNFSDGSPRKGCNTVNSSNLVGPSHFGYQSVVPLSAAECKMSSPFLYTCQLSNCIDMVVTAPNLFASDFLTSWSPPHSVASDMMFNSVVCLGRAIGSPEILASSLNGSKCDDGGHLQCPSESQHGVQLSQDCLSVIQDLRIDIQDDSNGPGGYTSDENRISSLNAKVEVPNIQTENPESESLFYEPPRLPNLDIPFVNCDLVNSCNYFHQAYSPLGVRQMIMSSVNCSTPSYYPWGSPFSDRSPEALLRSAAKSFTNTPSILRKRQRESSSLVQENQNDKKVDDFMDYGCFCTPSSLIHKHGALQGSPTAQFHNYCAGDGIFLSSNEKPIVFSPPYCLKTKNIASTKQKEKRLEYASNHSKQVKPSEKRFHSESGVLSSSKGDEGQIHRGEDAGQRMNDEAISTNVQTLGVLVERNMNGQDFVTPCGNNSLANCSSVSPTVTPKTLYGRRMEMVTKLGDMSGSYKCISGTTSLPCVISPNLCRKKLDTRSDTMASICQVSNVTDSSPIDHVFDKDWLNSIPDLDNLSVSSLDKGLVSPLEWKSPWSLDTPFSGKKDGEDPMLEPFQLDYSPRDLNSFNTPGQGGYSRSEKKHSFIGGTNEFSSPSLYLLKECR
eukprot:Gb_17134 [translate_table: standard]